MSDIATKDVDWNPKSLEHGRSARHAGKSYEDCPQGLDWNSRSFRQGWRDADKAIGQAYLAGTPENGLTGPLAARNAAMTTARLALASEQTQRPGDTAITNGNITINPVVTFHTDPNNADCALSEDEFRAQQEIAAYFTAAGSAPEWLKAMREIVEAGRKAGHTHLNIPAEYALWLLNHVQLPPVTVLTVPEPLNADQIDAQQKLTEVGRHTSGSFVSFDPIERLEQVMAEDPYPQPKGKQVRRYEDMSPKGRLTLYRQEDGDVVIEVVQPDEDNGALSLTCIEFCTPMIGGGQSSHTHRALVALMVAMEKDEAEGKQVRR